MHPFFLAKAWVSSSIGELNFFLLTRVREDGVLWDVPSDELLECVGLVLINLIVRNGRHAKYLNQLWIKA
jgi:hypothetical protein